MLPNWRMKRGEMGARSWWGNSIPFPHDLKWWSQFQVRKKVLNPRDQSHTATGRQAGLALLGY